MWTPTMSSQQYAQSVLKVAIAQICQTIGWHSTHASTMDLLIDVTQHFLREISRIMHAYCELYNRSEANLDDLALAYKEVGINMDELMEYIQFVDPIPMPLEVPRFPLPKESNLNFLKPGSREVLMRPVHIPEYMPPMHFEEEESAPADRPDGTEDEQAVAAVAGGKVVAYGDAKALLSTAAIAIASALSDVRALVDGVDGTTSAASIVEIATTAGPSAEAAAASVTGEDGSILPHTVANEVEVEIPMQTVEVKEPVVAAAAAASAAPVEGDATSSRPEPVAAAGKEKANADQPPKGTAGSEEGRPTREISSVIMTTSGFISPAREGKLPESRIPIIPEERPIQPSTPAPPPPPPPPPPSQSVLPAVTALSGASTLPSTATSAGSSATGASSGPATPGTSKSDDTASKHGIPFAPGDPVGPVPSSSKASTTGTVEKKKVKKKPVDREKKKADKSTASTGARKAEKALAGASGSGAAPLPAGVTPAGDDVKDVKLFPGTNLSTEPVPPAGALYSSPSPPKPALTELPSTPGRPLAKEKTVRKRNKAAQKLAASKATLDRSIAPLPEGNPASDVIEFFPVKPKSRPKASKKSANQRQPPPLIGPPGLGSAGTVFGAGALVPNPLHFAGQANEPGLFGAGGGALPRKVAPAPPGPGVPPPDQVSQLNLLQMMHPSLEITASPAPRTGPAETGVPYHERDVIVIDDDKTPPHAPNALLSSPAPTPTTKAKKQRMQDTMAGVLAGTVHPFTSPVGAFPHDSPGFSSSSPHTPTTGIPKTPDIRLQSSPSSTASWSGDSGRLLAAKKNTTGNLFVEMSSKPFGEGMGPGLPLPPAGPLTLDAAGAKKPKRPRQKPKGEPKRAKMGGANKQPDALTPVASVQPQQQQPQPPQPLPDAVKNPFALFPGAMNPFAADPAAYGKYLNQSMPGGLRNPMPFGLFPLPSGPGLIPDNPLFPRLPSAYPGQPRPGFPMPGNPFGLPGISQQINNLLRMPRPPGLRHPLGHPGGGMGGPLDYLDEPLDPETKLAQTPLDLQKSTCNVAPLVPPSLFQSAADANELLNLSVKPPAMGTAPSVPARPDAAPPAASVPTAGSLFADGGATVAKDPKPDAPYKEDQVVILPAASVLPGASPSQRSSLLVIDIDDSDGSQSTATTGGKSKDGSGKRGKLKEHKKDRKLKEGKVKKKKDKKDKSKGKEREREQAKELTAGTASSTSMLTMGMIGAEEAVMEQLRKQRKEKKEKRKEKLKKEKRKDRDRVGAAAGPAAGAPTGTDVVPKLMLKIGGSNATQSPRSDAELVHAGASFCETGATKRDGSPELARISALVTRPPKLKASGSTTGSATAGTKAKKDDSGAAAAGPGVDHKQPFQPGVGTEPEPSPVTAYAAAHSDGPDGAAANRATKAPRSTSIGVASVDGPDPYALGKAGPDGGGGTSKARASKEAKAAKSAHHHHHAAAPATDTFNAAPAHMTDVDGNTVWICPACGRVDDGTPMIGCDGCDAWYHWVCVGIQVPPEDNEDWYCRVCIAKKQDSHADEKQRKRKKKDKKTAKD
uniref:PHD-type domain-containing protein n=1 Tax=Anopheles dirus TaxID=7168 RepID=A0A182N1K8_9DIPT